MGSFFSKIWDALFEQKNVKILMIGLDYAGKTTILHKLKIGETIETIPTIGFNVEKLKYKGLNITVWDIGGQIQNRIIWKHYYQNTNGLIFVVDSNDKNRINEAVNEFKKLLFEDELKNCPILIMANKQDLNNVLSPIDIANKMEMKELKDRTWLVQGTSATTAQGLKDGLDWLAETLLKKK